SVLISIGLAISQALVTYEIQQVSRRLDFCIHKSQHRDIFGSRPGEMVCVFRRTFREIGQWNENTPRGVP
ncbi:MAG: hypothetical protein WCJ40_19215, partial [Planctomycetota bacterium]